MEYESRYEHFKRHEGIFVVSMCRNCKMESVHPDFLKLNEDEFKEHSCQEIEKEPTKGQEISKAIFLETPLPKKQTKILKDIYPKMGQIKKNSSVNLV